MSDKLKGLPIPEECNVYNETTLKIILKKSELYDAICDSSATEYMVKLEQQIKQLKEENQLIKNEMIEKYEKLDNLEDEIQSLKSQLEEDKKDMKNESREYLKLNKIMLKYKKIIDEIRELHANILSDEPAILDILNELKTILDKIEVEK